MCGRAEADEGDEGLRDRGTTRACERTSAVGHPRARTDLVFVTVQRRSACEFDVVRCVGARKRSEQLPATRPRPRRRRRASSCESRARLARERLALDNRVRVTRLCGRARIEHFRRTNGALPLRRPRSPFASAGRRRLLPSACSLPDDVSHSFWTTPVELTQIHALPAFQRLQRSFLRPSLVPRFSSVVPLEGSSAALLKN